MVQIIPAVLFVETRNYEATSDFPQRHAKLYWKATRSTSRAARLCQFSKPHKVGEPRRKFPRKLVAHRVLSKT